MRSFHAAVIGPITCAPDPSIAAAAARYLRSLDRSARDARGWVLARAAASSSVRTSPAAREVDELTGAVSDAHRAVHSPHEDGRHRGPVAGDRSTSENAHA